MHRRRVSGFAAGLSIGIVLLLVVTASIFYSGIANQTKTEAITYTRSQTSTTTLTSTLTTTLTSTSTETQSTSFVTCATTTVSPPLPCGGASVSESPGYFLIDYASLVAPSGGDANGSLTVTLTTSGIFAGVPLRLSLNRSSMFVTTPTAPVNTYAVQIPPTFTGYNGSALGQTVNLRVGGNYELLVDLAYGGPQGGSVGELRIFLQAS